MSSSKRVASIADIVGPHVVNASGRSLPAASLSGRFALYFSAFWCRPCREFTPLLREFQAANPGVVIVFVSSDKSIAEFREYMGNMPWVALPYEDRERKALLTRVFKVKSIPSLVLFDELGNLVTHDGMAVVTKAIEAGHRVLEVAPPVVKPGEQEEPGRRVPLPPLEVVSRAVGEQEEPGRRAPLPPVDLPGRKPAQLAGPLSLVTLTDGSPLAPSRYYCLYFSASWCGPCKAFTPVLGEWYARQRQTAGTAAFEVVFVSGDRTQAAHDAYAKTMPWKALAFEGGGSEAVMDFYGVSALPTLMLVSETGGILTGYNARKMVDSAAAFPWQQQ